MYMHIYSEPSFFGPAHRVRNVFLEFVPVQPQAPAGIRLGAGSWCLQGCVICFAFCSNALRSKCAKRGSEASGSARSFISLCPLRHHFCGFQRSWGLLERSWNASGVSPAKHWETERNIEMKALIHLALGLLFRCYPVFFLSFGRCLL